MRPIKYLIGSILVSGTAFSQERFCGKVTGVRGYEAVSSVTLYDKNTKDDPATKAKESELRLTDSLVISALENSTLTSFQAFLELGFSKSLAKRNIEVCLKGYTRYTRGAAVYGKDVKFVTIKQKKVRHSSSKTEIPLPQPT